MNGAQQTATTAPAIGSTVAIVQNNASPQIGTYLGIDTRGHAHVQRAIGGSWSGDRLQVIG